MKSVFNQIEEKVVRAAILSSYSTVHEPTWSSISNYLSKTNLVTVLNRQVHVNQNFHIKSLGIPIRNILYIRLK